MSAISALNSRVERLENQSKSTAVVGMVVRKTVLKSTDITRQIEKLRIHCKVLYVAHISRR